MTSVLKAGRQTWLIGALAAISIMGLALAVLVGIKQSGDNNARADDNQATVERLRADLACVETYANAQYQRSVYIQEYLQPRNDAFADLEVAIALNKPAAQVDALRRVFIQADARYRQVTASQPLPQPPQFVCEGITARRINPTTPNLPRAPGRSPSPTGTAGTPGVPSLSPRPGPPMTRTVPRTAQGGAGTRSVTGGRPSPSGSRPSPSPSRPGVSVRSIPVIGPIVCGSFGLGRALPALCS